MSDLYGQYLENNVAVYAWLDARKNNNPIHIEKDFGDRCGELCLKFSRIAAIQLRDTLTKAIAFNAPAVVENSAPSEVVRYVAHCSFGNEIETAALDISMDDTSLMSAFDNCQDLIPAGVTLRTLEGPDGIEWCLAELQDQLTAFRQKPELVK